MEEIPQGGDASALLERQNRELTILTLIATALNESVDLHASMEETLSLVAELLELQAGWIWLFDASTGKPFLAAAANLPASLADHPGRLEKSWPCLAAANDGRDPQLFCSRMEWLDDPASGLCCHASVPLHSRGGKVGVMNIASTTWREFSSADVRMLHLIGEMLGVAIERSELFKRNAEAGASVERNRLAREIHDTLAQGLAASVLQLETAEALLDADGDSVRIRTAVSGALNTTRQNLVDVRRSVLDLRPTPLQGATLAEALSELCGAPPPGGPEIIFKAVGADRSLPTRFEVGLYRVAQEALANALRHANAKRVKVRLHVEPRRVTLTVADDGAGFDAEEVCGSVNLADRRGRFGLTGICERARLLGGELRLASTVGEGTEVSVTAPLS